eukprot:TRINITY_DN6531_c0_g1_i2.p1 TRINITY_DN6531_c0_g1~~TRINITY_DN6531_c0_g1_i2.p1  ORF type:complete len:493 (-),score=122.35 TRINITY_DN6531_c0_g1_i2:89-1567(-)
MTHKDSHRTFLRSLTLLINFFHVHAQDFARQEEIPSCQLPSGKAALCVAISQCGHLTSLIGNLQQPLPRDVSLLIRDSFFCGSSGGSVSVCCPLDGLVSPAGRPQVRNRGTCEMQGGEEAECVKYSSCSPFVQMMVNLKKPLHPAVPSMVRSSFLCGIDDSTGQKLPQICCPSAALAVKQKPPTTTEEPEPVTHKNKYSNHPGKRLLADESSCGISSPIGRIVGGQDALMGQYPWLVNLGYRQEGKPQTLFKCGGTLIGNRHVLTAAHCVTELPRNFKLKVIRVGEHDLDKEIDCDGEGRNKLCAPAPQDIGVEEVIFHQSYGKPKAFQNDIAVIKLERNVTENEFVAPICLPFDDDNENYLGKRIGADASINEVAGWGATTITGRKPANILQFLGVDVTDADACKEIYAERGGVLTEKQICAGGTKGKDSCVGDSGSGLMRSIPNRQRTVDRWDLIGVVSFGPRLCGTEGVPGVYTRVNSYLDWILDNVSS